MLNHRVQFSCLLSAIIVLALPTLSYAAQDPLSQYENLIEQAQAQPVTNGTQQGAAKVDAAITSGRAALAPTAPAPQTSQAAPVQNTAPAPVTENPATASPANTTRNPAGQQTAPAGPPNIFITPGGDNSTNKQSNSIIHY